MNAVVLTVKASYVASTKYRKLETKVLLQFLHTFSKGIAAIVYFQKGIAAIIYFGFAVLICFHRTLLPS